MANSTAFHESLAKLSAATQDSHRALLSLQEELEAVDWYQQRAEACEDEELRTILLHNMQEEIEHAMMVLEWLRRQHSDFDRSMRTYLFQEKAIATIEASEAGRTASAHPSAERFSRPPATIGSLRRGE